MFLKIIFIWHIMTCVFNYDLVNYYSKGMSEYCRLNNNVNNFYKMKKDLMDEIIEFINEIKMGNIKEAFSEFLDVWHCIVKFFLLLLLPIPYYNLTWKFASLIVPYYCIKKHGIRYKNTKCIRSNSHHKIKDHICNCIIE